MKKPILNFIVFLLIFGVFFCALKLFSADNYIGKVFAYTKYEDSRDLEKIINSFEYPVANYWGINNVKKNELQGIYKRNWERTELAQNFIQEINQINDREYILHTLFKHKSKKSSIIKLQSSKVKFLFNSNGKINSIINLSLNKISYESFTALNKLNKFSYKEEPAKPVNLYKIILGVISLFLLITILFRNQIIGQKNLEEEKIKKEEEKIKREEIQEKKRAEENRRREAERIRRDKAEMVRLTLLEEEKKKAERIKREERNRIAREKRELEEESKKREERNRIAREKKFQKKLLKEEQVQRQKENNNNSIKLEDEGDAFFKNHLSSYMVEFDDEDDDSEQKDDDVGKKIIHDFMSIELKNKLKNK